MTNKILREMKKKEPRNIQELKFYTTDDLRRLYQNESSTGMYRLRDGILNRDQIRAVILHRVWWERFNYLVLLVVSAIAAIAAVIAALEGWMSFK